MTSFKAAKMLVGLSCLTSTVTQAVDFCGKPAQLPVSDRYDCIVEKDTSCLTLFLDLAALSESKYTKTMIKDHRDNCCDDSIEPSCDDNPLQGNPVQGEEGLKDEEDQGDFAFCRICGNNEIKDNRDEKPGLPDVVISARYVGTKTCMEFYYMGVNKDIPTFMCGPMQGYAFEACGCGEFNPDFEVPQEVPEDEEQDAPGFSFPTKDIPQETEPPTLLEDEEQDSPCALFTKKDSCKEDKSCKWKKKEEECQDKSRHLRGE
jgi:hypothetical protein